MRQIKFRAWDKKSKVMRKVESMAFGLLSKFAKGYPVCGMLGRDCIEQKDIIIHRDSPEFELLQYTGLKDKNGVEIYEGDIVQHKTWYEDEEGRALLSDSNSYLKKTVVEYFENFPFVGFRLQESCEVIGNIYENPELLEPPQEQDR